jgi:hypothetical protein
MTVGLHKELKVWSESVKLIKKLNEIIENLAKMLNSLKNSLNEKVL